ncbi:hypothetical protein ACIA5D_33050 [Actinoplanes sp. NPDC051513]|uniref:hypothetical protein n=1 Tax=Actinoplanes sp. NPDC051513 TaxID=3363908 RepID=UPI0037AC7899
MVTTSAARIAAAPRTIAASRLTAILGLTLAVGVLAQGLFAGAFMSGDHQWLAWHEALGNALVLPPLASLVAALVLRRRHPDPPAALATRVFLLALVIVVIATGHAGRDMLVVHIPAALALVGIAVRQAAGFVRVPNIALRHRREQDIRTPDSGRNEAES